MTSFVQKRTTSHKSSTKQIDHALGSRKFKTYVQFRKFSVFKEAIRKCSPFYGTRRLITAFTKVCHWILAMIQMNSAQPHTSHFFHVSFNFVTPSTLGLTRHSSVVGIAIRLRAGRPRGSNPDKGNKFPSTPKFPDRVWSSPSLPFNRYRVCLWCGAIGA